MSHPIASVLGRLSLFLVPTSLLALVGCDHGYNVYKRPLTPSERLTDTYELDVRGPCRNLQDAVNKTYEAAVYHCVPGSSAMRHRVTRQPVCEQGRFSALVEIRCK